MNEDLKRWDEIANSWSKNHFKEFRPFLIFPAIKQLAGTLSGKRILDAGCGDGVYCKLLTEEGAEVIGLDGSENMVRIARENNPGIKIFASDLLATIPLEDISFDLILSILILMSLSEIQTFLSESRRLLKPDGSLIIVVKHPAFSDPTMKLYKSIWQKLRFAEPDGLAHDYFVTTKGRLWEKEKAKELPYYHRTLQDYSAEFKKAGFAIDRILEPNILPKEYLDKNPKLAYVKRLPRFIIFNLKKV